MDLNQRLDVLAAVPLFSQVGKRDLERLASSVTERQFAAGTEIVKEGEIGVAMFVIAKGEVEAVKGDGGSEVHVADIGAGGYFGEMALFEHFPRNATISPYFPTAANRTAAAPKCVASQRSKAVGVPPR